MTILLAERIEGGLVLTLNRPEKRNALSPVLLDELATAAEDADRDPDVHAIVVTGAGDIAFSAGFDISEIRSPDGGRPGAERDIVEASHARLCQVGKPIIAMVNGAAIGAGCDLLTSCDLRIAGQRATFSMPPARLGVLYSWQGMRRMIALVGPANAKELFMTAAVIDASRAMTMGLVHRVVPDPALRSETEALVAQLAADAPLSIQASKQIIEYLCRDQLPPDDVLEKIRLAEERVWHSEDLREGVRAFQERRRPVFKGV